MTYAPYPAYKPSGVSWLGDIPVGWEVKRLKYIASYNDETLPESTESDYQIQYVDISNVSLEDGIKNVEEFEFEKAPSRARRIVQDGDTIVSTVRTYLKAIAAIKAPPSNLIVSTGFAVVRPKKDLLPRYLGYFLQSEGFVGEIVSKSVGVSYPAINAGDLVGISALLPPLSEQRAIAAFLDAKTAEIDALIAKKNALLTLLAEQRIALITQAVTKGLNPDVQTRPSGISWLGDIPESWQTKRIQYVARLRSGDFITADNIDVEGSYPVFGGNGLRGYTDSYTHKGNYVLVGRQGALCGNINYASGTFWASEHALVAHPLIAYDYKWLGYLLQSMNLNQYSVSAAQPGLSVDNIAKLKIPFPPINQQRSIVSFIDLKTAEIDGIKAKIEEVIIKLKEYRTALITNAVTGKIKVTP